MELLSSAQGDAPCTPCNLSAAGDDSPCPSKPVPGCVSAQPAHSLPLVAPCLDMPSYTDGEGETPSPPCSLSAAGEVSPYPSQHVPCCVSAQPAYSLSLVAACLDVPSSSDGEGETPSPPSRGFCRAKVRPASVPALAGRHAASTAQSPAMLRLRRYIAGDHGNFEHLPARLSL